MGQATSWLSQIKHHEFLQVSVTSGDVLVLLLGLDAHDEDAVELVAVVLALQFPRAVDLLVQPGRLQGLLDQLNVGVVRDAGRDLDDGVQVACGRANG